MLGLKLNHCLLKARQLIHGNRPARNNLTVLSDDAFLASYPKSGNTWMRFVLAKCIFNQEVSWSTIDNVVPDIYRMTDQALLEIDRPRLLKTHHTADIRYQKVIYLVRNPVAVLTSYFYFHLKFKPKLFSETFTSLQQFVDLFLDGSLDDFGTWSENVASWTAFSREYPERIIILRYEDIMRDPAEHVGIILKFLGLQVPDEIIRDAIRWGSKSNMAQLEEQQKDAPIFRTSNSQYKFVSLDSDISSRLSISEYQEARLREKFRTEMTLYDY